MLSCSEKEEFYVSSYNLKSLTLNQHYKRARTQLYLLKWCRNNSAIAHLKRTFEWQV